MLSARSVTVRMAAASFSLLIAMPLSRKSKVKALLFSPAESQKVICVDGEFFRLLSSAVCTIR
ncbi:hypothetical protein Barb4_05333 [Bacteroidales bacterium Barb4]|nr:hypothetical protein Barb4_05333 [Bacteroidales bacterium Barb4]